MTDTPQSQRHWDVAIVGGGPAGATAALYAARADLSTLVLDKGLTHGALGVTQKIGNYPGVQDVLTGAELLTLMWDHAQVYGATIVKRRIVGARLADEDKTLMTGEGEEYHARAVILCTGAMGRASTVPGEQEFLGRGVSYCATCDAAFFRAQTVFVYGGNEEAAEEALYAARFAGRVLYAYPTRTLDVAPELQARLDVQPNVERLPRHRLLEVHGGESVTAVLVRDPAREEVTIPAAGVFIYTAGNKPIVDYVNGALTLSPEGHVAVDAHMHTNLPGVFACGDITCNEVQQAVVAAAQGCIAALSADKYLNARGSHRRDYE